MERLTNGELDMLESGWPQPASLSAKAVSELRARRSAELTEEDVAGLEQIRYCIVEREGEYVLDMRGADLSLALDALTKLLAGRGGK